MTAQPLVDPRTWPAKKDTEDWLRSTLYAITGKCWSLSYTNRDGHSQSEVIYASYGCDEIAYCDGEPQTRQFLQQRLRGMKKH